MVSSPLKGHWHTGLWYSKYFKSWRIPRSWFHSSSLGVRFSITKIWWYALVVEVHMWQNVIYIQVPDPVLLISLRTFNPFFVSTKPSWILKTQFLLSVLLIPSCPVLQFLIFPSSMILAFPLSGEVTWDILRFRFNPKSEFSRVAFEEIPPLTPKCDHPSNPLPPGATTEQ